VAPIEVAPIEVAPVEVALVEVALVEVAPVMAGAVVEVALAVATASASAVAKVAPLADDVVAPGFATVLVDAAVAACVCRDTRRLWMSAIRALTPVIPFNDSYLRARRP
jgi:hypothetical protein